MKKRSSSSYSDRQAAKAHKVGECSTFGAECQGGQDHEARDMEVTLKYHRAQRIRKFRDYGIERNALLEVLQGLLTPGSPTCLPLPGGNIRPLNVSHDGVTFEVNQCFALGATLYVRTRGDYHESDIDDETGDEFTPVNVTVEINASATTRDLLQNIAFTALLQDVNRLGLSVLSMASARPVYHLKPAARPVTTVGDPDEPGAVEILLAPNVVEPCYDCGSPFAHRHTALCAFKEEGDVLDLPMAPGSQWWTKKLPA